MHVIQQFCEPYPLNPVKRSDALDARFDGRVLAPDAQLGERPCIALLGVPQHIGVERNGGRVGAAEAPAAIRAQFYKLTVCDEHGVLPHGVPLYDCGDIRTEGKSLEQIHEDLGKVLNVLLSKGAFVIVLGGGHDLAWPDGHAVHEHCGSLAFVNVDAHPDMRPLIERGSQRLRHSGSGFRQLLEAHAESIPGGSCTEFGLQPFVTSTHHVEDFRKSGHAVLYLSQCRQEGVAKAYAQALDRAERAAGMYCSFDIDACAGEAAPGVSAVAVDGFGASDMIGMIAQAAGRPSCLLLDLVEVNPRYDVDHRTAKLAAQMLAHAIGVRMRMLDSK